jgi:hypothetical protein
VKGLEVLDVAGDQRHPVRLGGGGEPAQTGSPPSSRVRYLRGMQRYRELETTTPDVSGAWLLQ